MSERRILDADRYRLSNWEFKCGTATEDDYHLGLFSDETVSPLPSPRNANLFPLIYYKHLFTNAYLLITNFHPLPRRKKNGNKRKRNIIVKILTRFCKQEDGKRSDHRRSIIRKRKSRSVGMGQSGREFSPFGPYSSWFSRSSTRPYGRRRRGPLFSTGFWA